MRQLIVIVGALLAMHVAPLYSAETSDLYFSHFDWELACDNTRTCRAAGYWIEEYKDDSHEGRLPVSVQIVRKAGSNQAVTAELQIVPKDDGRSSVRAVAMKINGHPSGVVQLHAKTMRGEMSPAQVNALVAALAKDSVIEFSDRHTIWTLSSRGAAAVLLKMDEFQGRIGTPGALLRKGNKPEAEVLPPLPTPVVLAAAVPESKADETPLADINLPLLLAELHKDNECDENAVKNSEDIGGIQLSKDKLLVSAQCWTAPYNSGDAYWVINRTPPYAPVLVTTEGDSYENGEISSYQKGRGMGDCVTKTVWTWDGQQFIHTLYMTTGMCRGFAGGAWDMLQYVASVRKPATK